MKGPNIPGLVSVNRTVIIVFSLLISTRSILKPSRMLSTEGLIVI